MAITILNTRATKPSACGNRFSGYLGGMATLAGVTLSLVLFSVTQAAQVKWDQETVRTVLSQEIQRIEAIAKHPIVVNAVSVQNQEGLSLTNIKQRDKVWITSGDNTPFKLAMLASPASQYLNNIATQNPSFTELLLIDHQGANVAVYPLTSDYWQGDEMKWQSIITEKRSSHVGSMEYDQSSGLNSIQISLPIEENGTTIGVIVVGVRLSHILAKQLRQPLQAD